MTRAEMFEIARANVEANLSDAVCEDGEDSIYNSAYTLAYDALYDNAKVQAECKQWELQSVATEVAMCYAQP